MKLAIIDLGSNSARMTVWEITPEKEAKTVLAHREYVRLSEGLTEDDLLKDKPMNRTVDAVQKLSLIAEDAACDQILFVATEALRRAKNKDEFTGRVHARTGLSVRILTGREEAYYDYLGSCDLMKDGGILCDVGGGSAEIAEVTEGQDLRLFCEKTGAVVMYELFGEDTDALLLHLTKVYGALGLSGHKKIVALGGTARAIGTYFSRGEKSLHGKVIPVSDIKKLFDALCAMTPEKRKEIPALGQERGDISACGLATFVVLSQLTGAQELVISSNGLREGMLKEWIDKF